jgi:hypothetical protein
MGKSVEIMGKRAGISKFWEKIFFPIFWLPHILLGIQCRLHWLGLTKWNAFLFYKAYTIVVVGCKKKKKKKSQLSLSHVCWMVFNTPLSNNHENMRVGIFLENGNQWSMCQKQVGRCLMHRSATGFLST